MRSTTNTRDPQHHEKLLCTIGEFIRVCLNDTPEMLVPGVYIYFRNGEFVDDPVYPEYISSVIPGDAPIHNYSVDRLLVSRATVDRGHDGYLHIQSLNLVHSSTIGIPVYALIAYTDEDSWVYDCVKYVFHDGAVTREDMPWSEKSAASMALFGFDVMPLEVV